MVVVLIIGILLAIAIPTFLGARERGQDVVAKTSLRNAVGAVLNIAMSGDFDPTGDPVAWLNELEGSLAWRFEQSSDGPKQIDVAGYDNGMGFAARSESGTCFYIYGWGDQSGYQGKLVGSQDGADPCRAADAQAAASRADW